MALKLVHMNGHIWTVCEVCSTPMAELANFPDLNASHQTRCRRCKELFSGPAPVPGAPPAVVSDNHPSRRHSP